MDCDDITEYEFARKYFLNWRHWQMVRKIRSKYGTKRVCDYFDEWADEMAVKVKSAAIKQIVAKSKEDKGYQAAKYLADKGWVEKKAGQPSKEAKERQLKIDAKVQKEVEDDLKRMGMRH
jgi:ABC-type histidine transport system ATPase subunit